MVTNTDIQVEYDDLKDPNHLHLYLHDVFDVIPVIGLDRMYCVKCNNIVDTKCVTIYLADRSSKKKLSD